jgi:hypothetical protein
LTFKKESNFSGIEFTPSGYGAAPPKPRTCTEYQGHTGVMQVSHYLKQQGYTKILFNQDRDNLEKEHPDLLGYNPTKGWQLVEVKYFIKTGAAGKKPVSYSTTKERILKTPLAGLPMTLILVLRRPFQAEAYQLLKSVYSHFINGLPDDGAFSNTVSKTYSDLCLDDTSVGRSSILPTDIELVSVSSLTLVSGAPIWPIWPIWPNCRIHEFCGGNCRPSWQVHQEGKPISKETLVSNNLVLDWDRS